MSGYYHTRGIKVLALCVGSLVRCGGYGEACEHLRYVDSSNVFCSCYHFPVCIKEHYRFGIGVGVGLIEEVLELNEVRICLPDIACDYCALTVLESV